MGTIKTTNIETITGSGTLTLGQSGETITIPSGVTITNNGTQTGFGGANTPAFEARLGSTQNFTSGVVTKIQLDTEIFDTDSCYDNATNYRFTPTTAGKYYVYAKGAGQSSSSTLQRFIVYIRKNGSNVYTSDMVTSSTDNMEIITGTIFATIEMNGSTDYVEIFTYFVGSGTLQIVTTNAHFGAYKIIE